jgi:AraC-like DNA-binding protein
VTTHVRRILDVIEQSYAERITLNSIGKIIDRQSAYLGHLFRKEVGMTVRQSVTQVRLEHAAVLIREGVKIEAVSLLSVIAARRTSTVSSGGSTRPRRSSTGAWHRPPRTRG